MKIHILILPLIITIVQSASFFEKTEEEGSNKYDPAEFQKDLETLVALSNYEIGDFIGKGLHSSVFVARHIPNKTEGKLKSIAKTGATNIATQVRERVMKISVQDNKYSYNLKNQVCNGLYHQMYVTTTRAKVPQVFYAIEWAPKVGIFRVGSIKGTTKFADQMPIDQKDKFKDLGEGVISSYLEDFDGVDEKISQKLQFEIFKMEGVFEKSELKQPLKFNFCIGFMPKADGVLETELHQEHFSEPPLSLMMSVCKTEMTTLATVKPSITNKLNTPSMKNSGKKDESLKAQQKQISILSSEWSVFGNVDNDCKFWITNYLIEQVVAAVSSIHDHEILHMDLKLDNFLIMIKPDAPKPTIQQSGFKSHMTSTAKLKSSTQTKSSNPIIKALKKFEVVLNDFDMVYTMPLALNSLTILEEENDFSSQRGTCNVFFFEKKRLLSTLSSVLPDFETHIMFTTDSIADCENLTLSLNSDDYFRCKIILAVAKVQEKLNELKAKYCQVKLI